MSTSRNLMRPNPFRRPVPAFHPSEPHEEAISRIEYLREQGGGWCIVCGPHGSGKSVLLAELARRAGGRGEWSSYIDLAIGAANDWLPLVAQAWQIPCSSQSCAIDLLPRLQEHVIGWATVGRPLWLLWDHHESLSPELVRCCRWLSSMAARQELPLTMVLTCRPDADQALWRDEADQFLELWPWERHDCARYVEERLHSAGLDTATFTPDAVTALHDRSDGVPGTLAKLCEFSWLAGQAETEATIGSDLVHAVADELLASPQRTTPLYEISAGYGAW